MCYVPCREICSFEGQEIFCQNEQKRSPKRSEKYNLHGVLGIRIQTENWAKKHLKLQCQSVTTGGLASLGYRVALDTLMIANEPTQQGGKKNNVLVISFLLGKAVTTREQIIFWVS